MTGSITFTRDMAEAVWEGRKTQTRRVSEKQDWPASIVALFPHQRSCVPHKPGDVLRVREPYWEIGRWEDIPGETTPTGRQKQRFVGDGEYQFHEPKHVVHRDFIGWHKRNARVMPAAYARQSIRITHVRVQRVQEISKGDALAEGVHPDSQNWVPDKVYSENMPVHLFGMLWDSINASRGDGWDENPWVAAYTFERMRHD